MKEKGSCYTTELAMELAAPLPGTGDLLSIADQLCNLLNSFGCKTQVCFCHNKNASFPTVE